jgi:hypothetical protein
MTSRRAQRQGERTGVGLVLAARGHDLGQRDCGAPDCFIDSVRGDVVERQEVRTGADAWRALPTRHRIERPARQHVRHVLLVVPRVPFGFARRIVAEHVRQDVAA